MVIVWVFLRKLKKTFEKMKKSIGTVTGEDRKPFFVSGLKRASKNST
jgi:hypothetical protein